MTTYTAYFLDDQKAIVSFDFIEAGSDIDAWSRVPHMLKFRTESRNVEVYEGARRVPEPAANGAFGRAPTEVPIADCK